MRRAPDYKVSPKKLICQRDRKPAFAAAGFSLKIFQVLYCRVYPLGNRSLHGNGSRVGALGEGERRTHVGNGSDQFAKNALPLRAFGRAMLFGLSSGASLATVVGVPIEVPVMLMLVKVCVKTAGWFK